MRWKRQIDPFFLSYRFCYLLFGVFSEFVAILVLRTRHYASPIYLAGSGCIVFTVCTTKKEIPMLPKSAKACLALGLLLALQLQVAAGAQQTYLLTNIGPKTEPIGPHLQLAI